MNRTLQGLNLLGVLALAVLCAYQWRINRQANLDRLHLETVRQEQSAQIAEQYARLKGLTADLDDFRTRLISANVRSREAELKVAGLVQSVEQLTLERDQLRESVTNWAAAVAARDDQLREVQERLRELASERNDSVIRFNELAAKHNTVIEDLNQRTRDFNALVEKYNALAKSAGDKAR